MTGSNLLSKQEMPKSEEKSLGVAVESKVNKPRELFSTPGYSVEAKGDVVISHRQQLEWQATIWTAAILRERLRQNGIGHSMQLDTERSSIDVFSTDIGPILQKLQSLNTSRQTNSKKGLSDQEYDSALQQFIDAMQKEEFSLSSLTEETRVVTITDQNGQGISVQEANNLLAIWDHDMRGKLTSPYAMIQLLNKKRKELEDQQRDPEKDESFLALRQRVEDISGTTLQGLSELLEDRSPLTQVDDSSRRNKLYSHEKLSTSIFPDMIAHVGREMGLIQGDNLQIHLDKALLEIGSRLSVNWNAEWAKGLLETLLSNAIKAHEASDTSLKERIVDVFIGINNGQLSFLVGDRGNGFPLEMIEGWDDPEKRETLVSGWVKADIATTGLGLRGHAGILEKYGGNVSIFNFSPQGGGAVLATIPLVSPPSPEVIRQIESS